MFGTIRRARMTVGRKIYALICLSFVGLLGVAFFESRELASSLDQQKQIELRHLGELALGIVKEEHAAAQKGGVSDADAQKRAMARIGALRYGNNDYFWINDMHPKMVMHPIKPEMNGNDLSTYKDPNGKLLFVDFVNTVKKSGSGFVPYEWPKPGFDKPQPKLSYVVGFAPWNWVVGTGVYIDDLKAQTWASTQRSLIVAGVILLFMLVVSIFVARSVTGPLRRMTAAMNDLASGNLAVEVPGIGRGDEVGEMAKAVESVQEQCRRPPVAGDRATRGRDPRRREPQVGHEQDGRRFRGCGRPDRRDRVVCVRPTRGFGGHADRDRGARAGTHDRSRGGLRGSFHQRTIGGLRHRGDGLVRHRDQPPGAGIGADGQ